MINQRKAILPIILLFLFVNSFLLLAKNLLTKYGLDREVLIVANIICVVINALFAAPPNSILKLSLLKLISVELDELPSYPPISL